MNDGVNITLRGPPCKQALRLYYDNLVGTLEGPFLYGTDGHETRRVTTETLVIVCRDLVFLSNRRNFLFPVLVVFVTETTFLCRKVERYQIETGGFCLRSFLPGSLVRTVKLTTVFSPGSVPEY